MRKNKQKASSLGFSQMLYSLRPIFTLRYWVNYLPISTPAPRVPISAKNLERNAQLYTNEFESKSEFVDSSLFSSTDYDSSRFSVVPHNGLSSSSKHYSYSSLFKSPSLRIKYCGDLPAKSPYKPALTIFAFDADQGRFEKFSSSDDELPEILYPPEISPSSRRYQRIRDRCEDWLDKYSQYYDQPPLSDSPSDVEFESGTQFSSAINPDDSVSQVAAREAARQSNLKKALHYSTAAYSGDQAAVVNADRVAELESQLEFLRAQLAEVIYKQTVMETEFGSKKTSTLTAMNVEPCSGTVYREIHVAPTASVLTGRVFNSDECENAGSDSGVMDGTCSGTVSAPFPSPPPFHLSIGEGDTPFPPPPPPPPPPPQNNGIDWRRKLLEKRGINPATLPAPKSPADMSQVLKELTSGTIKLRTVRRSVGGTPIKDSVPDPKRLDPAELIGRALKAKFANVRYELESPEKSSEKDNQCEFSPPPLPVFMTPVLKKIRRNAENSLVIALPDGRSSPKSASDSRMATAPAFGRHLLRPVNRENLPPSIVTELHFDDPRALVSTPERR